jgi:hypothetical protein
MEYTTMPPYPRRFSSIIIASNHLVNPTGWLYFKIATEHISETAKLYNELCVQIPLVDTESYDPAVIA